MMSSLSRKPRNRKRDLVERIVGTGRDQAEPHQAFAEKKEKGDDAGTARPLAGWTGLFVNVIGHLFEK